MAGRTESDEVQRRVLAKHNERVIRLRDEVDNFIKMIVAQREAAEAEWVGGYKLGKESVNPRVIEAMESLVRMLNTATMCKLRLEKAERSAAESMTPEQERREIANIIKSWETRIRRDFLTELGNWHRSYSETTMAAAAVGPRPGAGRKKESDADSTD